MEEKTIVERKDAKVETFTVTQNGKDYKYKIQDPTFDQISAALTESIGTTGKLNMSGGGKVIFELCCLAHDKGITENPRILLAICLNLYDEYVLPADIEIKKN